ncbi:restriction endonuclease [Aeromonas caviae]|uniref:restriction endonuclease n=1 Tax=Aeromonas caviae TaxID=648 RepID=UPI002B4A9E99|nr:restriction endonuclease [Aeromonas caviae]
MTKIDVYDISPQKFEELAFRFLQDQGDLTELEGLSSGIIDSGYDFSATLKDAGKSPCKIAIEAKHRRKLSKQDLYNISEAAERIKVNFNGFILITSAKLTQEEQDLLERLIRNSGYTFIKIYQDITFEVLTRASNRKAAAEIARSKKSEMMNLAFGVLAVIASLTASTSNIISYFLVEGENLDTRIENVSSALDSIKNLEMHLTEIKSDMQRTQRESEAIKREYEKSQELKQLTNDQQAALRSAIGASSAPWWVKPLDYFIGFILGIGASVIASFIHERIKRNKVLNSPA